MSLREVPPSKPLLARKGAASPANLRTVKGGLAEPTLRAVEGSGEIALETATSETAADPKASAVGERVSETSPAASLLPFDLLRKKYRPDISPDLVEDEPDMVVGDLVADDRAEAWRLDASPQAELTLRADPAPRALKPIAPPKLRVEPAAPAPEPQLNTGLDIRSDAKSDHRLSPRVEIPRPAHAQSPGLTPDPAPAPKPDPDWRVGVAAVPAAKRASGGGWLLPLGALVAAFAALVVGWNMTNPTVDLASSPGSGGSEVAAPIASAEATGATTGATSGETTVPVTVEPPPPVAEAQAPKLSDDAVVAAPALPTAPTVAPSVAEVAQTLPEAKLPAPNLSAPNLSAPMRSAPMLSSTEPLASVPLTPKLPAAGSSSEPDLAVPATIKPTVDLVRLEANGDAVIAGRAAPNSELIVLDNGEPIGTVRADAFGEWVFVPETALPIGDHEFGLVLKTVQESVSLPAPSKPLLPPAPALEPAAAAPDSTVDAPKVPSAPKVPEPAASTDAEPAAGAPAADDSAPLGILAPIPLRRPVVEELGAVPDAPANVAAADALAAVPTADFVVQLASVKTRDGAQQEWRKLQQRFPDILADMVPALDEVKLVDHGTVVRVRTGAFSNQRDAASLCARLVSKNQECLVVRVSTGN